MMINHYHHYLQYFVALMVITELKHWQGSIDECVKEYAIEYGLRSYDLMTRVDELIEEKAKPIPEIIVQGGVVVDVIGLDKYKIVDLD